jgi:carbonic anhydrase/acetyltransferase-like protein (isoleucine patch superfamily)
MNDRCFITSFNDYWPEIADDAFVDISARLIGRVRIGKKASIWPGAVLRADDEEIIIGKKSAVLDLSLIEAPSGYPVIVAEGALISHKACLHGATVKSGALVGIGAIVLDGAVIGEDALIGAGSVVPPAMEVPPGMLVLGQPAKPVRELKKEEKQNVVTQLKDLRTKADVYLRQLIKK